jgi:predicted dehydrogenase
MIRIGVLGTGRVVPYGLLAPAKETQGVEVSGIASRTLQKAEEFAARHEIRRSFGSYQALLASGEVDAVYIALPTALHYDWARKAIEAGKHVLCEKPLAANAQLARELVLSARQHGRVLVEAMHILYLERICRQRELLAGGEFGRLLRIESCFRTPYTHMARDDFRLHFELGGGAALDVGCYAVSCLRYVAGEEPEILSVSHKCSSPQIDRWMHATLRFPSGAEGAVEFGVRGLYMPKSGIKLWFKNGWIRWNGKGLVYEKNGVLTNEALPTKSTYQLQLEAFAKSIRGEKSNALLALRGGLQTS